MHDAIKSTIHAACVVLYLASGAVVLGALAAICTQRLRDGLLVAVGAFIFACAGLGYSVWRSHRPPKVGRRLEPHGA